MNNVATSRDQNLINALVDGTDLLLDMYETIDEQQARIEELQTKHGI